MTNQSTAGRPRYVYAACLTLGVLFALAGCKNTATDDASLTSAAQAKISADGSLSGQPIQASVASGVATLNGTVTSAAARSLASDDVAKVAGIKTVVNNLTIQPTATSASVSTPPPAPIQTVPAAPVKAIIPPNNKTVHSKFQPPAPIVRNAPPPPSQNMTQNEPPPPPAPVQEAPLPPPAPPVIHKLTVAAGETLPVRVTQNLDSATTQTGETFTGVIASDVIVDGLVAIPHGTPVTGHVDAAHDAGHFSGNSLLTISLSSITRHGERISVTTDTFSKEGNGRGKNTAEKVGGGAAVGAILGGILGGGKGAAIGAAAGGGVGAGANGITRGQQVQIPSETLVRFRLANAIVVRVNDGTSDEPPGDRPVLNR